MIFKYSNLIIEINKMTKIVIVGGGFGGVMAALGLEKKFRDNKNIAITLIDQRDYHLFTPNLFEAATAEEELVSVGQMKKSITLPFKDILTDRNIKFIQSELKQINQNNRQVTLDHKQINYDYLILALGSQSEFFNIAGAEKFALVLKDLPDALRIRNQIEFAVQSHKLDVNKKTLRLVVAGGGYTGVELAGELKGLADFLAWKNQYPREKIEIEVIEAANALVPGFDSRLSRDAYERLQELGIRVRLSARVSGVDQHFLELMSGDKIAYDVLMWTMGVRAANSGLSGCKLNKKGRLEVNEFFQVLEHQNIFALGDIACVTGRDGKPVPSSAQDAQDQAKYLVYALPYIIKNQKPPKPYQSLKHGFIVNVGGKWAILSHKGLYITGWLAYFIDKAAHLRYYLKLMNIYKAVKYVIFQMEMYSRND